MRHACVVEAATLAGKMLDPSKRANFTEANARELAEAFSPAQAWVAKGADGAALAREVAAADLLSVALVRATEGQWSVAVSALEDLLASRGDSLLVRLLSDGSALR